jgi:hypothetical protein
MEDKLERELKKSLHSLDSYNSGTRYYRMEVLKGN